MTRVRYKVSNEQYAVRDSGGLFGSWIIRKKDEEQVTDYGAYVSLERAKQLKKDLGSLVGEGKAKEADVIELLDEINGEPKFTERGGVVVYFINSGEKTYSFNYIGKVGKITIPKN
jgi:hypothetical protein